jgi:DNA-binding winged helix-turn-helix (wHTH) protein/tetratricopeptide (TPR) repeat protein
MAHMYQQGCAIYEFGPFRLDPAERLLTGGGHPVTLSPKAFDLLVTLVRSAGRMVEKRELMQEVWPDTFVEENNLTVNMSALRKALWKASSGHDFIQTVPRRGYRFAGAVSQTPASQTSGTAKPPDDFRSTEPDSNILVGREIELEILQGFLSRAIDGTGGMIFVTGEPGIGKTALSQAFLRQARSRFPFVTVCGGRCLELYGAGESYLPFLDALSGLLSGPSGKFVADVLRSHAPTWCLQFPAFFGSAESLEFLYRETVGATKERMLREMADALGAVASVSPLVLHLEDLHWADVSSVDLLRRLCLEVGTRRLLVTGTFRPEDVECNRPLKSFLLETESHKQCEGIALGLLSQHHLEGYLDARFRPNRFEPELVALIHRKTEGQPLFATSLIQFLVERGDIARAEDVWILTSPLQDLDPETPANVRKMIRRKVESLNAEDRRALEYASVQGEEFTSVILAKLLEMDELAMEERLDYLDKVHQLIQTTGVDELPDGTPTTRYRFRHVLYQNSLYNDAVNQRRVRLHRQTGELMIRYYGDQAPRFATQLAMHFERGRDFHRAIDFLIQAGDNAAAFWVPTQACEHFSRALELTEKLPPDARSEKLMTLFKRRADANLSCGDSSSAEDDYTSLLSIAKSVNNAEVECRALTDLANIHLYTRKPQEMAICAGQALEVAERIGHRAMWCEAKAQLAASHQVVGRLPEAHGLYEEAIPAARSIRHIPALLQGLTYRGVAHFFQSEYEQAVTAEREALDLASKSGNAFYVALTHTYLGFSLANQGRISEAISSLKEAIDLGKRNENRIVLARAPNGVGWIHREVGSLKTAIEFDEAGVETARRAGACEAEANALINLVYDYTFVGDPAKALAAMHRVDSLFDREIWNRWRFHDIRLQAAGAEYCVGTRELERAEEYALRLLSSAERYGVPKYVAVARRLLGETAARSGDLHTAEEQLTLSANLFAKKAVPLGAWRTHAALGRLYLRFGDRPAAAREAFRLAAGLIQTIRANITEPDLEACFLRSEEVRQVLSNCV